MDFMGMKLEETANQKAVRGFAKILAVVIVLAVVAFSDVAYIQHVQKIFAQNGLLLMLCYVGAFTSFLAMGYLLIGKSAVFAPGPQLLASWILVGVEIVISILNILLVFNEHPTGILTAWAAVSPATPVIVGTGVLLILFLDPELKEKHKDMEMASEIRQAHREHQIAVEKARLLVQKKHLEFTCRELQTAINSAESQKRISDHAKNMNDRLLTELSGQNKPKDDDNDDDDRDYYNANRFGRK